MKTNEGLAEIRECFRLMATAGDPCGHMARFMGVVDAATADLSRLAAIEEARAKGGLTETRRDNLRMLLEPTPLLQTERNEDFRLMLRLDDALKAANEENARLKRVLSAIADHCDDDHAGAMERARKTLEEATP